MSVSCAAAQDTQPQIVHDAEYYILEAQNGDVWAQQDKTLDARLAELRTKHGRPPNIIHVMWDDTAVGELGFPAIQMTRGFETPHINSLAAEGLNLMRMYTEPSCTPSRADVMTGRLAVRSGMHTVTFPVESGGIDAEEVTMAEVLSQAGYATAFYGKWHLGDTEPSYPTEQGFDEALWTPYNQVQSLWTPQAEALGMITGLLPGFAPNDPYVMDQSWQPRGAVWTLEGTKDGPVNEWGPPPDIRNYWKIDTEGLKRTLEFSARATAEEKPFYVAFWPVATAFLPNPEKRGSQTVNATISVESFKNVDNLVGGLVAGLKEQGIEENTLVVIMADNGPFTHDGPAGMVETLYRGGKGDALEGGVRVPAMAWWPGTITPNQTSADIIHESDLFTTFARIGQATQYIPTDRVIDGIDQTSLLLNGDGNSRRDYVFIYTGPKLAAAVKGRFKRDWAHVKDGLSGAEFYDLYADPREMHGQLVPLLHTKSMFNRQRQRHELWIQKYPNSPHDTFGLPLTGIANARPETDALSNPPVDFAKLPFSIEEVIGVPLPWSASDGD